MLLLSTLKYSQLAIKRNHNFYFLNLLTSLVYLYMVIFLALV